MLLLGVGIMAVSCSKDNANKEIIQWGDDLSGWVTAVYQDGVLLEDIDYAPFDYVLLTWFRSYDGGIGSGGNIGNHDVTLTYCTFHDMYYKEERVQIRRNPNDTNVPSVIYDGNTVTVEGHPFVLTRNGNVFTYEITGSDIYFEYKYDPEYDYWGYAESKDSHDFRVVANLVSSKYTYENY